MQNVYEEHLPLVRSYIEECNYANVEPTEGIIKALKASASTGELNLSSLNLNVWSWQSLCKLIATDSSIRTLNISNCLIPPRGLAAICSMLGQGSKIEDLDLRGNNIQSNGIIYLGKMLRYNISLKRISLEWNCLGEFRDIFTIFCDGIAANQSLEMLDLRNNHLHTECALALANALKRNSTLNHLDLRWNNLGWKGGRALHSVFQKNQSLVKLELQGNCIPMDISMAIEECSAHNAARKEMLEEYARRTAALARHVRRAAAEAAESRAREFGEMKEALTARSDHKLKKILRTNESRVEDRDKQLAEKDKTISSLEQRISKCEEESQKRMDTINNLKAALEEKDMQLKQVIITSKNETEDLNKMLLSTAEELRALQTGVAAQLEAHLAEQRTRRAALEAEGARHADTIALIEKDLQCAKSRMDLVRQQLEQKLERQKAAYRALLTVVERRSGRQAAALRERLRTQRVELEGRVQQLQRSLEQREAQLADCERERESYRQEAAAATAAATAAAAAAASAANSTPELEERLAEAREQLQQLQLQNSTLVTEAADVQRKMLQVQEELLEERSTTRRLRQELDEEGARTRQQTTAAEKLQAEVDLLHHKVSALLRSHVDLKRERQAEREHLEALMKQRDKQIEDIRTQEMERANHLYTAFSKYLSSVSPACNQVSPT